MTPFYPICLLILGITCLHPSCEAKISDLHPNLAAPENPKILKNPENSSARLHQTFLTQNLPEFYKAAVSFIGELEKEREARDSLPDTQKANSLWLFNIIAQTPLLDLTDKNDLAFASSSLNSDLRTKERALYSLFMFNVRKLLGDDKNTLAWVSSCYTAILGDLLKTFRSYTPPESPQRHMHDDLTPILVSETEKTMQKQWNEWKKQEKDIKPEDKELEFQKWSTSLDLQLSKVESRYTNIVNFRNTQYVRNKILINIMPRVEVRFIELLLKNHPGKKSEILNYIRMAGYQNDEIDSLLNRTLGRNAKTDFLYKTRSKRPSKK